MHVFEHGYIDNLFCSNNRSLFQHDDSAHGSAGGVLSPRGRRPSETQLVAVWIGDVEEPLSPFGVARCRMGLVPGGDQTTVERVDLRLVDDQSSPPRPAALRRLSD